MFKIVLGTRLSPGPTWDPWVPHGTHFGTHLILTAFWLYINMCKKIVFWTYWDSLGPTGTHWDPLGPIGTHSNP